MEDLTGRELFKGDRVVYLRSSRGQKKKIRCEIIGFTVKRVCLKPIDEWGYYEASPKSVVKYEGQGMRCY